LDVGITELEASEMKTFKAQVRVAGFLREVRVQAQHFTAARDLLEAQYGKGTVAVGPTEVR